MKRRIDYIPAIVMLLAALVSCVFTIVYHYNLLDTMLTVLISAVVFFMIGCIIRAIASKFLIISMEKEIEDEETEEKPEEDEKKEGEEEIEITEK